MIRDLSTSYFLSYIICFYVVATNNFFSWFFLSLLEIFWPLLARNHGVFPSKTLYVVSEHGSSLFVESTQLPLDTICKDLLAKNTSIILGLPSAYFLTTFCFRYIKYNPKNKGRAWSSMRLYFRQGFWFFLWSFRSFLYIVRI